MTRKLSRLAVAAAMALSVAALAACGDDKPDGTATVGVSRTGIGKVLVDSQGRTLYLFKKDAAMASACAGACAADWPPLRASGTLTAGPGAKASLVATTKRSDGGSQVTYKGHPLYRYAGDAKPGDTAGQGVVAYGAGWYALGASGSQVTAKPSPSDDGPDYFGGDYGY